MRDLSQICAPKAAQTEKTRKGEGYITIVNSKKNGKRIELLNKLTDVINFNDSVKIGFLENELVIVPTDANVELPIFKFKKVGRKKVIYSASLVQEIAEVLQLDFSERVCYTISNAEIDEAFGVDAVFVKGDV
ncbi:hypothetical protein [Mediterraneibacter gnavus]|uniref:hypothetical protein n=1 Tax=Mediterraneibacter gnavus TaxID=33038 RepID=UPI0035693713